MNNKLESIIDEIYQQYLTYSEGDEQLTREQFVNRCKTDEIFSESNDLIIEEKELTDEERIKLYQIQFSVEDITHIDDIDNQLTINDIATKLITLKNNNSVYEFYQ